jgi:hypothetical protein
MITYPQGLYRFLATPGIEVAALLFASDEVVCESWQYFADDKDPNLHHTNEVIDAYATAGARIHLYSYLDRLKQMALYCDTESVIYIQLDDQPALIETGDCLVAMTSELNQAFILKNSSRVDLKITHTEPSIPRQVIATFYVRFAE